jgi:hypothetical protein
MIVNLYLQIVLTKSTYIYLTESMKILKNSLQKKTKTVKIFKEVITKQVEIPPRKTLEDFFIAILTECSSFEALNGYFRQTNKVSMGGKISPSIANIFCNMFELEIIEHEINNGTVLAYYRYVDDIFVVLKKVHKTRLL